MRRRRLPVWRPTDDQMEHWPAVSGNAINGVGEATRTRPSPIYWHPPETIPHGSLQGWFYRRTGSADEILAEARRDRQRAIDEPLVPIAGQARRAQTGEWTAGVKRIAAECGADDVGVTLLRADYVFEGPPGSALPLDGFDRRRAFLRCDASRSVHANACGGHQAIRARHTGGEGPRQLVERGGAGRAPLWRADGRLLCADPPPRSRRGWESWASTAR